MVEEKRGRGHDEMYCSSCGSVMKKGAETCPQCGVRVQLQAGARVEGQHTAKPVVGGVLGVVAGCIPVIIGIVLVVVGAVGDPSWRPVDWVPVGIGIGLLVLGVVTITGSSFAIVRKNFPLAVAGGVCAVFSMWILGVPALVLIAISSKEFQPLEGA